jgi:hypothetical protein
MFILIIIGLSLLTTGVYIESGPFTAFAIGVLSMFIVVVYTLVQGFLKHIKTKQQNQTLERILPMKPVPRKDAEFQLYFKTNDKFQDHFISSITGRYMLDIMAFEKHMIQQHNYDPTTGSLKDFVQDEFGQDARGFISDLLTMERPKTNN